MICRKRWGIEEGTQLSLGRKSDVIDLGEVVVFTREPEDCGVRMACSSRLTCSGYCGCGLEGCKQWSAKEPNLLPGDNRARALSQRFNPPMASPTL